MSGGSYHYISIQDAEQIIESQHNLDQVTEMIGDLAEYNNDKVNAYNQKVAEALVNVEKHMRFLNKALENIQPVWKAQEWYVSADSGRDEVIKSIENLK